MRQPHHIFSLILKTCFNMEIFTFLHLCRLVFMKKKFHVHLWGISTFPSYSFWCNQNAESFSLNIKRTSDADLIVLQMHSYLHVQNTVCCLNLWIIEWASSLSYVFGPLNSMVTSNRTDVWSADVGALAKRTSAWTEFPLQGPSPRSSPSCPPSGDFIWPLCLRGPAGCSSADPNRRLC